ncbi:7321_t:CDS:2 [Paraglomus brasilianum]|uniref:7321_t:CDS:1 n=1 Tax=Paraglomus brasilianum TaxID=144538 RepID=A0A9N9D0T0_9GLOM|nr:7321_t:CDS:2 [Paraglomus brasilianum]
MSVTLFCLVKGNTSTNTFSVRINRDEPISELKDAIKTKKAPEFDHIPADRLKLWKVEIPDDRDSELANPTLDVELLATRDVEDYWTEKPPKRNYLTVSHHWRHCLTSLSMSSTLLLAQNERRDSSGQRATLENLKENISNAST